MNERCYCPTCEEGTTNHNWSRDLEQPRTRVTPGIDQAGEESIYHHDPRQREEEREVWP